ncbi:NepR family anti-sigma factor [Microvirga roseola]|uniref:NepR family anti-sigma factor n=1 Tax=Microvirga roseola TaxID=2883126 RepID=UPI001E47B094|nr:NepR family anti-sigma factor [Microvirga roseola]
MTGDKGNKLARVIPEGSLSDKLATNPKLDSTSQRRIGDQLRAMYDELMQQPVPDRFKELLDQLDKGSQDKAKNNGNDLEGAK